MPAAVKVSADGDKHLSDITAILFCKDHVFTSGGDGKIKVGQHRTGGNLLGVSPNVLNL